MNTTGIQNYLSNVFRPVFRYDTLTSNFTPKLELKNIDTYSGNVLSVFRADIGDSASNVYVGSNAGNLFNASSTQLCSNVTAFGYGAGSVISNDSNSVYIGWYAGANNSNTRDIIAIGSNAGVGSTGVSNIFIGSGTRSTFGSSNIFLGHAIDLPSVANQIRIGYGNRIPIAADITQNWVGLGGITTPILPNGTTLDVSGITRSTGGYSSIQGGILVGVGSATIGVLKKGIINISAVDRASPTTHFAANIILATSASTYVAMGTNALAGGHASITFLGSNIRVTNTTSTKTYDYNITYFPLP